MSVRVTKKKVPFIMRKFQVKYIVQEGLRKGLCRYLFLRKKDTRNEFGEKQREQQNQKQTKTKTKTLSQNETDLMSPH